LDWERFNTRAEAGKSAKQLMRRQETYVIEECDEATCLQCLKMANPRVAGGTSKSKYQTQKS
jgi:hypothetical protein